MRAVYRVLVAFGIGVSLAGCGESDDAESLDGPCDIQRAACQRAIFEATADVRGNRDVPMPPVRTLTLQQFADWIESQQEASSDEPDVWSKLLPLLRLMPESSSIAQESAAIAVEGVAAYYDTETKGITVLDRGESDPLDDVFYLSHEFVHAIQDADVDLTALIETRGSSFDSSAALKHLVEGEATVLGAVVLGRALGAAPNALNWDGLTSALRKGFFETVASSEAPLLAAAFSAPYALGTEQLAPIWLRSGQPAIDAFYEAPRLSVIDWTEDTLVTQPSRVEALDCLPTAGPPGFTAYGTDSLGVLGVFAATFYAAKATERAWSLALGVRGDRVVAFAEDATSDSYAIAWRIRFDSVGNATTFEMHLAPVLAPGAAIARREREVIVYATTQPGRLAEWTEPTHCGTEAELPPPRQQSDLGDTVLRRR